MSIYPISKSVSTDYHNILVVARDADTFNIYVACGSAGDVCDPTLNRAGIGKLISALLEVEAEAVPPNPESQPKAKAPAKKNPAKKKQK